MTPQRTTLPSVALTRIPADALRIMPTDLPSHRRLSIVFFDAPAPILPCGLPRPQAVACVCAFQLGDDFLGRARVERGPNGPCLAVETQAWDALLSRAVHMDYGLNLLRDLYREMGRLFTAEQARRHSRGVGRN